MFPSFPPELLVLPPLALAAGIDLYLTLLFLGAAPTTAWWDTPMPGALADLDSLGVLLMVGGFYVLEFAAERFPPAALAWNAFHAVIRPLAGALLALLVLDGQPLPVLIGGAVVSGALASAAHAVRSGGAILRWLGSTAHPDALLVSLLEDAVVLGIVALATDLPAWALAATIALTLVGGPRVASQVRAFAFAVRLAVGWVYQSLERRRWTDPEGFPAWVREALAGDVMAPGGGLRGSSVGAHLLPGAPRFVTGWVVVRGDSPIFVYRRRRGRPQRVDLGPLRASDVVETDFFRRVDLRAGDHGRACVFFGLGGPSTEGLRAEFLFR